MNAPAPQPEVYGTFTGLIDGNTLQKIIGAFTTAVNNKVEKVHLLIQSPGGIVNDAIAAYNFIRNLPIEVVTYNGGHVASAGVYLFLAGGQRKASASATFMIHRVTGGQASSTAAQLDISAKSVAIDDKRLMDIQKTHLKLPKSFEKILAKGQLDITAPDALSMALIDEISDFRPPAGLTLYNI